MNPNIKQNFQICISVALRFIFSLLTLLHFHFDIVLYKEGKGVP